MIFIYVRLVIDTHIFFVTRGHARKEGRKGTRRRDETRRDLERGKNGHEYSTICQSIIARLQNQMASVPGQSREMWLASGHSAKVKGYSIGQASSPFRPASITSPLLGLGAIPADVPLVTQLDQLPILTNQEHKGYSQRQSSCSTSIPGHSHATSGLHHRKNS